MRAKSVFQWPYLSTAMPPTRTLQCRTHCCLKKIIWHHDSFPSLATTVFRNRFAIAPDSCLHSFISPGASTFFLPPESKQFSTPNVSFLLAGTHADRYHDYFPDTIAGSCIDSKIIIRSSALGRASQLSTVLLPPIAQRMTHCLRLTR